MTEKCIATCTDGSECNAYPVSGEDKCRMHLGKSPDGSSHEGNDNAAGNNGGAPEGNTNNVKHDAFREQFNSHLTAGEQKAFDDACEQLETPEGAQDIARIAAANCLLQFKRTGDERFLRRFEGLCEKFNIAPAEETTHNHRHAHQHEHDTGLNERQRSAIDSITGGPEEIEVEAVESADASQTDDTSSGSDDDGDTLEVGW